MSLLRQPETFVAVFFSALIVLLYALINFGASLGMQGKTHDIPIAVVNADAGDTKARFNLGASASPTCAPTWFSCPAGARRWRDCARTATGVPWSSPPPSREM